MVKIKASIYEDSLDIHTDDLSYLTVAIIEEVCVDYGVRSKRYSLEGGNMLELTGDCMCDIWNVLYELSTDGYVFEIY